MLDKLFSGVFSSTAIPAIAMGNFLLCTCVSLIIGIIIAFVYTYKSKYTKSFVVTLAILPAVVCMVIMMVNGNLGAGVAVAGAFSLVRFRSAPGTAKEIGALFLAMGAGLAAGMGYLGYALLFTLILCLVNFLYSKTKFGEKSGDTLEKKLHITIPEDLDYTGVFDDLLAKYTSECELMSVKTTNMGSLFKLTYNLTLRASAQEKEFIDSLRCRNGNLEIMLTKQETDINEKL